MSSRARLVITAVVLEGRPVAQVAAEYGVHRAWVYKLVARYRDEGEAAFEPRSRRPHHVPNATDPATIALIVDLRAKLSADGLDAGPHTIAWHLATHHGISIAPATIWRHLKAAGLITPTPSKRPRTSYIRFEADLPNELWQTDFTHVRLADATDTEVLTFIDDHSRFVTACTAHHRVTGTDVVTTFRAAISDHAIPAAILSDNGMVFTTRLSGGRGGRNAFEHELDRLGIEQRNSRPNHPTTCGKVERVQQTLKRWLSARPRPDDLPALQDLLDTWRQDYNTTRPHRSLAGRTPLAAYTARPKAQPASHHEPHQRVRTDRIDDHGVVTVRHAGNLHHIGIGRTHARTHVILLIQDLHIRVIHAITGEILRELTLDPTRNYQPQERQQPEP
ncbi:IS481 family transposase [Cellulomonas triticagri]|uniref:IS481 family transposase n=1 Tax=Cellulomonas triticagri TaxID=2483352 RepID=A0A3M2JJB4_9CELL|nr:IS481 family transposase [Cellulomonas triticagri]RMI13184.1 IS481 family transposase [Cellulomonas triticagri]